MLPQATVAHAHPGRLRIRISEKAHDEAFFAWLSGELRRHDDVIRVVTNARTGSVLVEHKRADPMPFLQFAETAALFSLQRPHAPNLSLGDVIPPIPAAAVPSARDRTAVPGEARVVDAVLGATMLGLAVVQARRGKFLPAGLTLVFNALDFLKPILAQR